MPDWATWEERLLGVKPDAEVARLTGRTRNAVRHRRRVLGIASAVPKRFEWTVEQLALLDVLSDLELAKELGISRMTVWRKRQAIEAQTDC